jgi:ABC-type Fe3+-hydroxamate transport system substrate-binding protein
MPTALRIASLVPSATETLVALGLGPHLVARTGFCIHPREWVGAVAKVGGTKDVNLARLRALAPSHVVLNTEENRHEHWQAISAWPGVQCLISDLRGPREVPALLRQFAEVFGADDAPLQAALGAALALPPLPSRRVLYLIWRGPWMAAGPDTYISRLLAEAGWQSVAPAGARYPQLAGDDPLWRLVDEVWLSSEPYRFGLAHLAEVQALAPQACVRRVDGEACSWWGARTAAGLAYLRGLHRSAQ